MEQLILKVTEYYAIGVKFKCTKKDYDKGDIIGLGKTIEESIQDFIDSYELLRNETPKYKWS